MSKKNLIAGQSGGPTAAINSSLYGVVSEALKHTEEIDHVYGMVNGIEGFLKGTVLDFQEALPGEQLLALTWTPGAYLGSCRYKLPESLEDPVYPKLFQKFEEMNIGWFFYIGGNDSMDTVSKLSRYAEKIGSDIRILGEPKTIDNDLVNTDHTPGFGSAARYVASTVREITLDACVYEKKSVTIIEIMGRHAGWLTGAAALARKYVGDNPLLIYLPETDFDVSQRCSAAMLAGTDQQEGILAGEFGVQAALNGETGKMIAFKRQSDSPYSMKCTLEDVNVICNEEKTVPVEWITEDGSDVTEDFIRYARPLIQGTVNVPVGEDGLPAFVYRK